MGTRRVLPQSIVGKHATLIKAKAKKDGAPVGGNILSAITSTRLDTDEAAYSAGIAAITAAAFAQNTAVALAKPKRKILRGAVLNYFKGMNNFIDAGTIPQTARALYNEPIGNTNLPDISNDTKLMTVAAKIITADAARVTLGGIAMANPTIVAYTTIYNVALPVITAVSNEKSALTTAKSNLKKQHVEIDDCILHVWNEVETFFSLEDPATKRASARPWSVRYISTGVPSTLSGKITNSATGIGLANVKVRLLGSSHSVFTDLLGNYTLDTSLYGDLELLTTLTGYTEGNTIISKEDGVALVANVMMVHK